MNHVSLRAFIQQAFPRTQEWQDIQDELLKLFLVYKQLGDKHLTLHLDYCQQSNLGMPIVQFMGNHSGYTSSFSFTFENFELTSMSRCHCSKKMTNYPELSCLN